MPLLVFQGRRHPELLHLYIERNRHPGGPRSLCAAVSSGRQSFGRIKLSAAQDQLADCLPSLLSVSLVQQAPIGRHSGDLEGLKLSELIPNHLHFLRRFHRTSLGGRAPVSAQKDAGLCLLSSPDHGLPKAGTLWCGGRCLSGCFMGRECSLEFECGSFREANHPRN